ncbi:endo-alpha-N-acetylgalactosaminidase family protein [Paenibacillus silvisoli]|uniref:endo-alpha-N-acetylgalactosaminidase family protein n=1 Tax=Paenibacillus silvisoli TaxID=3110539 RepID=UPI002803FE56|nr:endo-alpha-N-acetylgalactosaminidase family protein [Paenibacillus silvisoli]
MGTVKGGNWILEEALVLDASASDHIVVLGEAGELGDGELAFTLTPLGLAGKVGALIRYTGPDSWIFIGCDKPMDPFGKSTWIWRMPCGKQGILFTSDPLYEGKAYRIELRFREAVLTVAMNGYEVYHGEQPEWKTTGTGAGAVGFCAWSGAGIGENETEYEGAGGGEAAGQGGHARIGDVKASELDVLYHADSFAGEIYSTAKWTLSSEQMEVDVDPSFPRVLQYRWKASGAVLHGQEDRLAFVELNGRRFAPSVAATVQAGGSKASYRLYFYKVQVEMLVTIETADAALTMRITEIEELGEFRIRTIAFPQHGLVSVRDTQEGATVACAEGIKGDRFAAVADVPIAAAPEHCAIAIVNTSELAATVMAGSSIHNRRRLCVQTSSRGDGAGGGYKRTVVWNAYWTYRGPDMRIIGEPWVKVLLTDDRNGDGIVDWQDGAIALREELPPIPGADALRRSYAHIAMNFGSMAQFPFLRILDNVKKFYLYTDGFGQMLELKGYQSEGHDSGHPDYSGNYNERAGGLADLNVLAERARAYGAVIGVHINHSEAYPEARAYSDALVTTTPGWRWLDQSYYIDRETDILNGEFDRRLDGLKAEAPQLGFIYVDTYRDEHWAAWRLTRKLREHGWTAWTEEADALDDDAVWTHDSTGDSVIHRFVRHQDKDAYAEHPLLKGGYARYGDNGFMGWQRERDLPAVIRSFYTKQLPYRYLMHYAIRSWKDEEIMLEGGVTSRLEDGVAVIRRHGLPVAVGNTVFLPWDPVKEEKIYYWNDGGGETAWQLPASWPGHGTVKLYRLTNQGRCFVRSLPIISGFVHIVADDRTPYVLYKEEAPPLPDMEWGEGSSVKDPGFDSHSFAWWTKTSMSDRGTSHIQIAETDYGQSHLRISGNGGADGQVSQRLSGLERGRTYSASVWVEVSGDREASIRVSGVNGREEEIVRSVNRTSVVNCSPSSDKCGTYYQRLAVRFRIPPDGEGSVEPVLLLAAAQGDEASFAHFDDVRVREVGGCSAGCDGGHGFYENFEHVDEGWGAFVSANPKVSKTHLSQLHEGCTADTLEGKWSLKTMDRLTGELLRTLPSTLRLLPNRRFRISFAYLSEHAGQYAAALRTTDGGPQHDAVEQIGQGRGRVAMEVQTGPYTDYYIAIVRNDADAGSLVIDCFAVEEL